MSEKDTVYKCAICGNIAHLLVSGGPDLICCGQPMEKLDVKTEETGLEKHKPVVEAIDGGILVKVGSIEHPMIDDHFIQYIEVEYDGVKHRKTLVPTDKPEAKFMGVPADAKATELCNIHGIWSNE